MADAKSPTEAYTEAVQRINKVHRTGGNELDFSWLPLDRVPDEIRVLNPWVTADIQEQKYPVWPQCDHSESDPATWEIRRLPPTSPHSI